MTNESIRAAFERFWLHVVNKISGKADINHNHDDIYYTEVEVDTKLQEVNTSIANGTTKVGNATHADNAAVAEKLGTETIGSAQQPVYLVDGQPTPIEHTIASNVPANAVFTDTVPDTWHTVTFTNAPLEECTVYGRYLLNDNLDMSNHFAEEVSFYIEGESWEFAKFQILNNNYIFVYYAGSSSYTYLYQNGTFQLSKTINFAEKQVVSEQFYNWLMSNSTHLDAPVESAVIPHSSDAPMKIVAGNDMVGFVVHNDGSTPEIVVTVNADPVGSADIALDEAKAYADQQVSIVSGNLTTHMTTAAEAIKANTDSISAHSTAIGNLQTAMAEIQEIASEEVSALFAQ